MCSIQPCGTGLAGFSMEWWLCAAVLCVYCVLSADKLVDIRNRGLAAAVSLLFHRDVPLGEIFQQLLPYNVHELHKIESNTQNGGAAHDVEKDLLLCGSGNVTVHRVGTGTLAAAEQDGHPKAIVQEVERKQGAHLKSCLEDQADDVGAEQTSINAPFVVVQFSLEFGLPVLPVGHM